MLTAISIGTGILGTVIGYVVYGISAMAFATGQNAALHMKFLGYSGASLLPISILSTLLTIITQNKLFFLLYLIPPLGIGSTLLIMFIKEKFITK